MVENRLASNSLLEACFCGMKCGEGLNASLPDFKAHMEENRETGNINDIIADYQKNFGGYNKGKEPRFL